ncbi:hypothetical protein [Affinirhizobium pseudoryzae]|uniref:hypothetical protein n=1 Tax=Allorhizobium pseudoryzae TaxID=379684 RepID=UPI0013E9A0AD|nr:hypothetical protein [Allorhizobium pseudoryzae]
MAAIDGRKDDGPTRFMMPPERRPGGTGSQRCIRKNEVKRSLAEDVGGIPRRRNFDRAARRFRQNLFSLQRDKIFDIDDEDLQQFVPR